MDANGTTGRFADGSVVLDLGAILGASDGPTQATVAEATPAGPDGGPQFERCPDCRALVNPGLAADVAVVCDRRGRCPYRRGGNRWRMVATSAGRDRYVPDHAERSTR